MKHKLLTDVQVCSGPKSLMNFPSYNSRQKKGSSLDTSTTQPTHTPCATMKKASSQVEEKTFQL